MAVAISILQTVEIASLSLRDALGAQAMTKLLIVIPTEAMRSIAQRRNLAYACQRPLDSRRDSSCNVYMFSD